MIYLLQNTHTQYVLIIPNNKSIPIQEIYFNLSPIPKVTLPLTNGKFYTTFYVTTGALYDWYGDPHVIVEIRHDKTVISKVPYRR